MDSRTHSSARSSATGGFTLVELLMVLTPVAFLSLGVITAYLYLGRNFTRMGNTQQQDVKARRALFYFTQDVGAAITFTSTTASDLELTVPNTLTVYNCATTSGATNVTCTSTTGVVAGMTVSGLGIPTTATVASITNATTFVLSINATATNTGLTMNLVGTPKTIRYLYDSKPAFPYPRLNADPTTLTRTDASTGVALTLLTDISLNATSPSNGFVYYSESGSVVTSAASAKSVEFSFTTRVGTANVGTQAIYKIVSPRVVARNKQFLP